MKRWVDVKAALKAWKRILKPKILVTTGLAILALFILIFLFRLFLVVTADITVLMLPSDIYTQEDEFSVEIHVNNYLLCESTCSASLEQEQVYDEQNATLRNNNHTFSFALPEHPYGEGREAYSVSVMCTNTGITFCDRSQARESALVVRSYDLPEEAQQRREEFFADFDSFLSVMSSIPLSYEQALFEKMNLYEERVLADARLYGTLEEQSENLKEEIKEWSYPQVPLAEAQVLQSNVNETIELLETAISEENNRREEILNLTIDPRVPYVLNRTGLGQDWSRFQESYEDATSQNATLFYEAFEQEAEARISSLVNMTNVTNTTFDNLFSILCTNCTLQNITPPNISFIEFPERQESDFNTGYVLPEPRCEQCSSGSPVLFLHGHNMNARNSPEWQLGTFIDAVNHLEEQDILIDGGVLTPYSATNPTPRNAWEGLRVGIRGTYYYDTYFEDGNYILSNEQSESIDTYAIRTRELITTLRERTGEEQITIVAHSMGGLVVRRYAQLFNDEAIELIMIATPNKGTVGNVASLCGVLGSDKECREMRAGSAMLARINDPNQPNIDMTVIAGVGCDTQGKDGDGIAQKDNVILENAKNYEIQGSCDETILHSEIVKHPEVFELLEEALR